MKQVLLAATAMMLVASSVAAAGHTRSSWADADANGGTSGWGVGWGDEVRIQTGSISLQRAATHTTSATPGVATSDSYAESNVASRAHGAVYTNGGSAMIETGASGSASASSSGEVQ